MINIVQVKNYKMIQIHNIWTKEGLNDFLPLIVE